MEKTLKSEVIFKGRIITVKNDKVILNNGRETTREIIVHHGSVCMLPIDKKTNSIYLVKQYRYAISDYILEIPAGTIEKDEDPEETAKRELMEEIHKKTNKISYMGYFYTSPGFITERMYVYLCEDLEDYTMETDFDENIEIVKLNINGFEKMINNNEIKDAKTVLSYLLWKNMQ